jgi:hypothetical protein
MADKIHSSTKDLGFTEVPQEPCVVLKDGIICFFSADDNAFAFWKKDKDKVAQTLKSKEIFTMTEHV